MDRGSRLRTTCFRRTLLVLAMLPLFQSGLVQAAVPKVDDRASLFSAQAVQKANQVVEHIYEQTKPAKDVVVQTLLSLPSGVEADDEAERIFRQRHLNGILILVVKNPHKLAITVGHATQERFHEGAALRNTMLSHFKREDYDGGLLAGVNFAEQALLRQFAENVVMQKTAAANEPAAAEDSPFGRTWLWLLLFLGGGAVLLLVLRSRQQALRSTVPSYTQGGSRYVGGQPSNWGAAPNAGGGWAKPILGGVAGAVAGNWLYDKFARGDEHGGIAHAAEHESHHFDFSRDDGDVGSTFGGSGGGDDWGSSDLGGGDGGGGGGDW